ncbi:MAG: DUF501 domain-containing protein [Acidimicrobiia bacterium]|nr:DUF501 domain-containing protein [Acidimicrobiia bacterium]
MAQDRDVVAAQIGREPRSTVQVEGRCHLAVPVVIAVPPHLDDGTPFPTSFWLTCPLASRRIGRLEADGGVKAYEERIANDEVFAAQHDAATTRYINNRNALVDPAAAHPPVGGVGGTRLGVKCLHAHYADHAAGNANPVGADVANSIEPLDCAISCVIEVEGTVTRNPDWSEPHHAHRSS